MTEDFVKLDSDGGDDVTVFLKDNKSSQSIIPVQELPADPTVQLLPLVVGQIVNPSKFYVQVASEYDKLNEMMDSLDNFYALDSNSSELSLEGCEVCVGDLVAVPWTDNMWYRGKVMGMKDLTTLKVFYIDYGSAADVKRNQARLLAPQFMNLPSQAMLAKLSGLLPADGKKWSGSSTKRMLRLTKDSHLAPLQAIIRGKERGKLAVWLVDNHGAGINELMVEEGFARYDERDSALQEALTAGNNSNVIAEITQLESVMLGLHKEVMRLCGSEQEEQDIRALLERATEQSKRLGIQEESLKLRRAESDCVTVEKKSVTTDWGSASIHLFRDGGVSWVTSAEISSLIREWRGWDLLEKRLVTKHLKLEKLVVKCGDGKWNNMKDNKVEGLKDKKGEFKEQVCLYRLDSLPKLFSLFSESCEITARSLAELLST